MYCKTNQPELEPGYAETIDTFEIDDLRSPSVLLEDPVVWAAAGEHIFCTLL